MSKREKRIGELNISNEGCEMKIIEYKDARNVTIEFQDGYKTRIVVSYKNFKSGKVKNPFHKSVYGIGYIGKGKYKLRENNKQTKAYKVWFSMIERCYDPYFLNKYPTYRDCIVCEEWHCFQNFAKWFYEHSYKVNNEQMNLDKDILYKGNKIYSPKTCIIVPKRINLLFIKSNVKRGVYPIGVIYHKRDNALEVWCHTLEKQEYLGRFPLNRPFQAFYIYKKFKENYIKQVADEYKNLIPIELYKALCKYKVEIND